MTAHAERVCLALTDNAEDDRITYDWQLCLAYIRHCADWRYGQPIRDIKACVAKLREAMAHVLKEAGDAMRPMSM